MKIRYLKAFENIDGKFPLDKLKELLDNRGATEELIDVINYTTKNAQKLYYEPNYILHIIAMFTLSYWGEKRAFLPLIEMAKLPDDLIEPLLEDTITEGLAPAFASTFDGDLKKIKGIIESSDCETYTRISALHSIVILLSNGIISRNTVVDYFLELYNKKNHLIDEVLMEYLLDFSLDIHPKGMETEIKNTMGQEYMEYSYKETSSRYEEQCKKTLEAVLEELKEDKTNEFMTREKVLELSEWLGGWDPSDLEEDEDDDDDDEEYHEDEVLRILEGESVDFKKVKKKKAAEVPFINTIKIARNDNCSCGSGKKYKKCCGK